MKRDFTDHLIDQWRIARPDLDPSSMSVAARIARLGALQDKRLSDGLGRCGLNLGEFDVLATLRRNDARGLPPKRLIAEMLLSSGAMTNRIDRLEQSGLVERRRDPDDRRGVLVRLTRKGRAAIDPAVAERFADADALAKRLSARERDQLAVLLRKLCCHLEAESS